MKFLSRKVRSPLYEINHFLGPLLLAAGIAALQARDAQLIEFGIAISIYWMVVVMLAKRVRPAFYTMWMCPDCFQFGVVYTEPDGDPRTWFSRFLDQHTKHDPNCNFDSMTLFLSDTTDDGPFGKPLSVMHIDSGGECKIEPAADYMLKMFMQKGLQSELAGK